MGIIFIIESYLDNASAYDLFKAQDYIHEFKNIYLTSP